MIDKAVELVGEGMRSRERTVFVSAGVAVGRRRIVFKFTAPLVTAHQHVSPSPRERGGSEGRTPIRVRVNINP